MVKAAWRDAGSIRALSFDCYGTLIDWEAGMVQALEDEGVLEALPVPIEEFLARREEKEREWQAAPYRHYREILALSYQETLKSFELKVDEAVAFRFADSIHRWPAFPDTVSALRRLGSYWPLAIASNVERASLSRTVDKLGIPFAELVTAEDVRSYKPAAPHFEEMQRRLGACQVHVAGSLFHDIEPAGALEIPTVWVNRRGEELPASAKPKLVTKDLLELCEELGV